MKVKDLIRICVTDTNYKFYFNTNWEYTIPEELYLDKINNRTFRNIRHMYNRDIILKDEKLLEMEVLSISSAYKNFLVIRLKTDKRLGYKNNRGDRFLI